jgi:hypothetical protein
MGSNEFAQLVLFFIATAAVAGFDLVKDSTLSRTGFAAFLLIPEKAFNHEEHEEHEEESTS